MAYLGAAGGGLAIIAIETAFGPTIGNLWWEDGAGGRAGQYSRQGMWTQVSSSEMEKSE